MQLYVSQEIPEKPLPHIHLQVLELKRNPFAQLSGWHELTPVVITVVVGAGLVPPHKHLNGHAPSVAGFPQASKGHKVKLSGTGNVWQS